MVFKWFFLVSFGLKGINYLETDTWNEGFNAE